MEDTIVVTEPPKEVRKEGAKDKVAKLSARSYSFIKKAVENRKSKLSEAYAEKYNNVVVQSQKVMEMDNPSNYQQNKLVNTIDSLKNIGVRLYALNELVNGSRVLNLAGNKIKAIKMPNISMICSIIKESNNISKGYKEAKEHARNGEYDDLNDLVGSINSDVLGRTQRTTEAVQPVRPTEPVNSMQTEAPVSNNFDSLFAKNVPTQETPSKEFVGNLGTQESVPVNATLEPASNNVVPPVVPTSAPSVNFFGTGETGPTFVANPQVGSNEGTNDVINALNERIKTLERDNAALMGDNAALHHTIEELQKEGAVKDRSIEMLLDEQYGPRGSTGPIRR